MEIPFPHTSSYISSPHQTLSLNETLDVVQPADVLVLLLDINIVGHKDSQGLRNTTLLEEALHQHLEVIIQAAEGRARVHLSALLGLLGALGMSELGVLEIEDVLDEESAVTGGGVDVESGLALSRLLDDNGHADGGGGTLVELIVLLHLLLCGSGARSTLGLNVGLIVVVLDEVIIKLLVFESTIIVRVEIVNIGNREADSDPASC